MPVDYRMIDGKTRLSAGEFNRRFGDINARLGRLEEERSDYQGAVDQIINIGLERIDEVLGPAFTALAESNQIADSNKVAINQALTQAQALLGDLQQIASSSLIGIGALKPIEELFTYGPNGLIQTVTERFESGNRVTTYTFLPNNQLDKEVIEFGTVRRTKQYVRENGRITKITITDVQI